MAKNVVKSGEMTTKEQAMALLQESEAVIKKIKIPIIISGVGLLSVGLSYLLSLPGGAFFRAVSDIFGYLWFLCNIATYFTCGKEALGKMWKGMRTMAFAGWILVPFPIDIVTGICSMIYTLIFYLLAPVIPVLFVWKDARKQIAECKSFLKVVETA